ncbi:DUF6415 family natural product biosynthesis protein [Streptomyces niveus]|uniref:DUF6415 family natural product biosynthesis protein n=1 Tax=Streptomyces niveus TaxID=193462 RepID=UPI003699A714
MTTKTIVRVTLAPREQQVVEGLADGSTLAEVAQNLKIRQGTASSYLKFAKRKLHGVSENTAALAVGYTTRAITPPDLLDPETLDLPHEQLDLVPLIARGMTIAQMATELEQSPGTHPVKPDTTGTHDRHTLGDHHPSEHRRTDGEPPGPQPRPPHHARMAVPDPDRGTGDRMNALTPAVCDKAEMLPLIEKALSWDLSGPELPVAEAALDMAERFTPFGRNTAEDLRALCLSIPADSHAHVGAQATLTEAARRLNLKPLARTTGQRSAAQRAQNLARLVQALLRATGDVVALTATVKEGRR